MKKLDLLFSNNIPLTSKVACWRWQLLHDHFKISLFFTQYAFIWTKKCLKKCFLVKIIKLHNKVFSWQEHAMQQVSYITLNYNDIIGQNLPEMFNSRCEQGCMDCVFSIIAKRPSLKPKTRIKPASRSPSLSHTYTLTL